MSEDAEHIRTGRRGESLAAAFLEARGFVIRARNYRWSRAEVDLIAGRGARLHFVEVKTRRWHDPEPARQSVTRKKQGLLMAAAGRYMDDADYGGDFQFDVIVVLIDAADNTKVIWTEDAFGFEN